MQRVLTGTAPERANDYFLLLCVTSVTGTACHMRFHASAPACSKTGPLGEHILAVDHHGDLNARALRTHDGADGASVLILNDAQGRAKPCPRENTSGGAQRSLHFRRWCMHHRMHMGNGDSLTWLTQIA